MAELIDVVNAMFTNKDRWKSISNEDKEKNFFIINRYMCKNSLINLNFSMIN